MMREMEIMNGYTGPVKSEHGLHDRLEFARAYGAWHEPDDDRPRCPGCVAVLVMPWCIWCDGQSGSNAPTDLASALARGRVLDDLATMLVTYFHARHGQDKGTELLLSLLLAGGSKLCGTGVCPEVAEPGESFCAGCRAVIYSGPVGPDYGSEAETAWEAARDLNEQEAGDLA